VSWALAAVVVGGALGATARFGVGRLLAAYPGRYATLAVNVLGSFALGAVVFGGLSGTPVLLVGTGVCGAFTTFSSFSVQTVDLWRGQRRRERRPGGRGDAGGAARRGVGERRRREGSDRRATAAQFDCAVRGGVVHLGVDVDLEGRLRRVTAPHGERTYTT
jgi:CrcB protein